MKQRQNPFRISALNSLKVTQVHIKDQKQLLNTFKGGSDLRKQLNKNKNSSTYAYKQTIQNATKSLSSTLGNKVQKQKPQHQALMDQIAALDNFKVPVTRQKTKNLIENIKVRRRQKHIQAYNHFREQLDDYKQNLQTIYQSLYNDCQQVLAIKQSQLEGYFNLQSEEYLLSREKDILHQFDLEHQQYRQASSNKLQQTREQLQRIKMGRGGVVEETCRMLREELIEIAFVLQNQARDIQDKQKEDIGKLQEHCYQSYKAKVGYLQEKQAQSNVLVQQKFAQVNKRWKQVKQQQQINEFQSSIVSQPYINSADRQQLYKQLIKLQQQTHQKKKNTLESLIMNQHVDSLRKVNIQKWNDVLKAINEQFDKKLDQIVQRLMEQFNCSTEQHQRLLSNLQERLVYIQQHSQEQVSRMLVEKFKPMVQRNKVNGQQMMKKSATYAQLNDQRQNQLLENLYKFFSTVSLSNDDFVRQFNSLSQKYEVQKAKILDDDEQLVEKLENQLETLKKQLRDSLHHIRLEEVGKGCFQKIDQIEQAYRITHEHNKQLAADRPRQLTQFMQGFEAKMAAIFQLFQETKRAQLAQRNKQQCQKQAMRRIQEQDRKKLQQEQKQSQLTKKNGGKAPPAAKAKDPKKIAAQTQQRKKAILSLMGQKKIQQLKTGSGNTWLVYRSLEQISREFYRFTSPAEQEQLSQGRQVETEGQSVRPLQVDQLPEPVTNTQGQRITTNKTIFKVGQVADYLLRLRDNIFENIDVKKNRILSECQTNDQEMLEQSLTSLDERLKRHYSLKGQLQAQIFVKRSGEISNHKKRYQKYARSIREKMDVQTQRFNFLLQKSLQQLKGHNTQQKLTRQQIQTSKNLSQLQGLLSKSRQNYNHFTLQISQILKELQHLTKTQVQLLLQKNKAFITESKLIKDGGEYSQEEIVWYQQMMKDITEQIKLQQAKREQKAKEIQQQADKRKKQLIEKFEKEYHTSIEELSAKDGTGKTYGKPKRTAQQKLRLEMNKCQQAQLSINKQIDHLVQIYQKQRSNSFSYKSDQNPPTLSWRGKLMTLLTCIQRYAKHIQALKKQIKIKPMIRVNYDESLPQCSLPSGSFQQDKKLLQEQLRQLKPLGQQKQVEKTFMKFVQDIEKIITDEARTIYVGDKAKFLLGTDKVPDFLRKYIANMRQSAEDFRQNSVREFRESCMRLSDLSENITHLFINSIQSHYTDLISANYHKTQSSYSQLQQADSYQKTQNLRLLRPNLSNPKCQQQLKSLNEKQLQRQKSYLAQLASFKQLFKSSHFLNGERFISCLINNYEFLLLFMDSLYLFEDFVKINGDDDEEKKKLNVKKLLVMKQKGISIDSSSERNLKKKWQGVDFTVINFDGKKFAYKKAQVQQTGNIKDPKKGGKKESKKPATQPAEQQSVTTSKQLQTFKTWRQSCLFQTRQKCLQQFIKLYQQTITQMYAKIDQSIKQNQMFNKKWSNIANQLFLK